MASSAAGFAIVTGANTGLGLHFVKSLYASGTYSAIVLACRSEQRAKSAIEQIRCGQSSPAENGNGTQTKLEFAKLDLTCNDSVRTFVSQLDERPYQKGSLRLLVNNAGIMGHPFQLVDGVEVHFASNHLGHFLLTNLLIKHNWLASDARILLVTSGLYEKCHSMLTAAELTTEAVAAKRSPAEYYAFSKLANCLHAVGLANRLSTTAVACSFRDVKVVAIRPGFVRGTELGRHTNSLLRMLASPLIWMVAKNLDQGISSMLHCAQCESTQLQNGALYYEGRVVPYNAMVTNEAAEKLWQMSEQMTKEEENGERGQQQQNSEEQQQQK
ncbi:hypothetical protein niasHT_029534 [Heterodera trifolii]|uniref:Uncharacterized protein n=1 Tax=Heterodera trifolii TaxID=157864 RepID=A0ABD2JB27_9BILA